MKRKLILTVVMMAFTGGMVGSIAAQQLNCQTGNCQTGNCQQQIYSNYSSQPIVSPQQNSTYESVPQVVYSSNNAVYQSAPVYSNSTPQYYSPTYASAPVYSTPVYSNQVYGSNSYPTYANTSTSTTSAQVTYPNQNSTIQSYPTQTYQAQVYPTPSYSAQSYPAQSYPVQSSQVQSYPTQTYVSGAYSPQTYPVSQAYNSVSANNANQVVQSPQTYATTYQMGNQYASTSVTPGLAQQKAQQAAQMGLRNHIGGDLGGAKYEGVGWSNVSPQAAIEQCCYWGQRPTVQIGTSKGQDGCWYACVLYN